MIFIPHGLRRALLVLGLSVPLSMLYVSFMRGVHWWRLAPSQLSGVTLPVFILVLILGVLIVHLRQWGCWIASVCGMFWTLMSGLAAIRLHSSTLGFFTVLLGGFFVFYYFWLTMELSRSFVSPKMKWYQGLPAPLPGLECELGTRTEKMLFRVNRIDREGAFIFTAKPIDLEKFPELPKLPELNEMVFVFRDKRIRCSGQAVTALVRSHKRKGYGLQFKGMSADARKVLGDFIETLKGEGYVS